MKLGLTTKWEMRGCSIIIIILMGTWLNPSIPDDAVSTEGLTRFQSALSFPLSGKSWGGSVYIYTNENWCKKVELVSSHCSEALLPGWGVFCYHHSCVHSHQLKFYGSPNSLHRSISDLQNTHPEGVFIVEGDFNQAGMKTVFPHFHQYVDFATREKNTLDPSYSNIKEAFKAEPHPHCSSSNIFL